MERIIKSRKRVRDFAEVYTRKQQVNAMLSLVPDDELKTTYLEPSCGNGNFIEAVLRRKIMISKTAAGDKKDYAMDLLVAAASIYGVDIQKDNVEETRNRMRRIIEKETDDVILPCGYRRCLDGILLHNIICGNTLTGTMLSGDKILFYEWHLETDRMTGTAYTMDDMLSHGGEGTVPTDSIYYSLSNGAEEMTA